MSIDSTVESVDKPWSVLCMARKAADAQKG